MPILGTTNAASVDNWQDRNGISGFFPPPPPRWTVASTPVGMTPRYGAGVNDDGTRIILAGSGGTITTSTDGGITWTAGATNVSDTLYDVEYISEQWIIASRNNSVSNSPYIYSDDGITWYNSSLYTLNGGNDIARSTTGSRLYATAANPSQRGTIFTSTSITDTWTARLAASALQSIRYLESDGYEGFIAVGYQNEVWISQRFSTDIAADEPGINWVRSQLPLPAFTSTNIDVVLVFQHPSYTRVIVGCSNGAIYYTDNWYAVDTGGVTWTQATVTGGNTNTLQNGTVNYFDPDNPIAYLVGVSGTILRSADGANWTRDTTLTTAPLICAVWVPNSNTVIVGGGQTTGIILRGN